jgi:hypothetical protein
MPTTFGRAVRVHVDDRHQLHVIVEDAGTRTFNRALGGEISQHPSLALVHTLPADFDTAVVGKQIRGLSPQFLVGVKAEDTLQVFDFLDVRESVDFSLQYGDTLHDFLQRGVLRSGCRHAGEQQNTAEQQAYFREWHVHGRSPAVVAAAAGT